ncbi:hypothetical protein [Sphaerochaeta halotolerans]|jgi:hypothetical protein|uniref:hypothetical protein n=1 Tax=Sphaerochaeta halotolerans TaxID=2293840 RepID=UPI001371DB52|nr:hypothetical protein [Sphaerochaeta halotolerans]MXI87401.1 hypothetical protein [Sphaerochaeta halotolerans]
MKMIRHLANVVGEFISGIHTASMYKATAQIEYEIKEMENSFTLMLFGNFVGLPSPPMPLALDLLPVMADDLDRMLLRSSQTGNGLSELASIMGEP